MYMYKGPLTPQDPSSAPGADFAPPSTHPTRPHTPPTPPPPPTHTHAHTPTPHQDVRIRVVELMDHVLSTYDRRIGEYTATQWKRSGAAACSALCSPRYSARAIQPAPPARALHDTRGGHPSAGPKHPPTPTPFEPNLN